MADSTRASQHGTKGASSQRRAQLIGTGLIGGSIGMALRRAGWWVSGEDSHAETANKALTLGALDVVGFDPDAEITFVAVPAGHVVGAVQRALAGGGVVTDVAGIKAPVASAVGHQPRFVGGHPMAGSEQDGIDGADPEMFVGATWVLTPTKHTAPEVYATLQSVISGFGANVVAVPPERHDALVAVVSHVPHLTAATLMNLASQAATEDATLLRLAAGGFRDMTRVAAGQPGIWPDVVAENRDEILATIDQLISALGKVRHVVATDDRSALLETLNAARHARTNLPTGAPPPDQAAEIRIPVPDRPGVIAEVATLLGELGINIFDMTIAHSVEGDRGVLVFVVDAASASLVRKALLQRHFHASVWPLEGPGTGEGNVGSAGHGGADANGVQR